MDLYKTIDLLSSLQPGVISHEDDPRTTAYKRIWQERRRMFRRAYPVATIAVGILFLLFIATLAANSSKSFSISPLLIVVYWILVFSAVVSLLVRPPRFILLLRRFRQVSRRETLLGNVLSEAAWGFANVVSVQDRRYKGDISPGYRLVSRYYLGFAVLIFVMWACPTSWWGGDAGFVTFLLVTGGLWILLAYLIYRTSQYHFTSGDCSTRISRLISRIHSRKFPHSRSTATIRLADAHWRNAVVQLLEGADCVVIDTTEMNDSVEWEIAQAYAIMPPEAIIITWAEDTAKDRPPGPDVVPEATGNRLRALIGEDRLSRTRTVSYPRMKKEASSSLLTVGFGLAVADAISHGMASRKRA